MTTEHPITIKPIDGEVVIHFAGQEVARSGKALGLKEYIYPEVAYLPPNCIDPALLRRSRYFTRCPHKGDASYYHIEMNGELAENAIWVYENPIDNVADIKGYFAFARDRVDSVSIKKPDQDS